MYSRYELCTSVVCLRCFISTPPSNITCSHYVKSGEYVSEYGGTAPSRVVFAALLIPGWGECLCLAKRVLSGAACCGLALLKIWADHRVSGL